MPSPSSPSAMQDADSQKTAPYRLCAIVPTYNNLHTIRTVITSIKAYIPDIFLVDDGSLEASVLEARALASEGLCTLLERTQNGGKGAAVKTGLEKAFSLGYTHALQIDADLQHNTDDIPKLIEKSKNAPGALVLAQPIFDESAPKSRKNGRKISIFWAAVETLSFQIGDPLCGFRVYPVSLALKANASGEAMDFDPEIAVRLVWLGCKVEHVFTHVRYFSKEEGGVSHFRTFADTALISAMHARLTVEKIVSLLFFFLKPFKKNCAYCFKK